MLTSSILRISLLPHHHHLTSFPTLTSLTRHHSHSHPHLKRRRLIISQSVQFNKPQPPHSPLAEPPSSSILLDVTGMMCGACASRVKSLLSSDSRVLSSAVNLLTNTAAVIIKSPANADVIVTGENYENYENSDVSIVADEVARKLTECGFPTKRRKEGNGVEEKVRKWKESVKKKEELMVASRNRVVFAWTLVALCCGSHASHLLHSVGIHVGHGNDLNLLAEMHNFILLLFI